MMKKVWFASVAMFVSLTVFAGPNFTKEDAVAMTEKAIAVAKKDGKQKLIERVNAKDPEFVSADMYVIVLKADGTHLAHPMNVKLIGKSLLDVADPDGKYFRKERVDLAATKGKGWVDYKYKNPDGGKMEQKTAYVEKLDDIIVSVGVFKP